MSRNILLISVIADYRIIWGKKIKKIIFIFIVICFFSCNNNPLDIDKTEIIGKEIDIEYLPYGSMEHGYFGNSYINGKEYHSYVTYYENKCLVYTYDINGIILDFQITNLVNIFKAILIYVKAKLPFHDGTDYSYVINKLGQPVTTYKASERYNDGIGDDYIVSTYCQKSWRRNGDFYISQNKFIFDIDGRLIVVYNYFERRP